MEVAYLCSLQHQLGLEDLPKSQAHVGSQMIQLGPSARVWVPLNAGRRWELPVSPDLASEAATASSTLSYWSDSHRTHLDSKGGDLDPTFNEKSIKRFLTILNLPKLEHLPFCFFPECHGNKLIHLCKGCSFALEDQQRYKYPCL